MKTVTQFNHVPQFFICCKISKYCFIRGTSNSQSFRIWSSRVGIPSLLLTNLALDDKVMMYTVGRGLKSSRSPSHSNRQKWDIWRERESNNERCVTELSEQRSDQITHTHTREPKAVFRAGDFVCYHIHAAYVENLFLYWEGFVPRICFAN